MQQVFGLVERIRASGLTVLIVEQNVRQVLRVVDRAYLLEAGTLRASGGAGELAAERTRSAKPTSASDSRLQAESFQAIQGRTDRC